MPGPGFFSIVGLGAGAIFGMLVTVIGFDFAGFELGKRIGRMQVEREIEQALFEEETFQRTGFYNLREIIDDYERRHEISFRLRRLEQEWLERRIEETAHPDTL
jgi:hypothetical protein